MSNLSKQDLDDLFNLFYGDFEALAVYLFLKHKGVGVYSERHLAAAAGVGRSKVRSILSRLIKMKIIATSSSKGSGTVVNHIGTKSDQLDPDRTSVDPDRTSWSQMDHLDRKLGGLTEVSGVVQCERSEPEATQNSVSAKSTQGAAPVGAEKAGAFPLSKENNFNSFSEDTHEQEQAHVETDSVNVKSIPSRQTGVCLPNPAKKPRKPRKKKERIIPPEVKELAAEWFEWSCGKSPSTKYNKIKFEDAVLAMTTGTQRDIDDIRRMFEFIKQDVNPPGKSGFRYADNFVSPCSWNNKWRNDRNKMDSCFSAMEAANFKGKDYNPYDPKHYKPHPSGFGICWPD